MWLTNKFIEEYAEKEAIVFDGKVYTYQNLYDRIKHYQKIIDQEITEGQVVAITSDYSFESIALFFALVHKKTIIVPIASTVQEEIKDRIEESKTDVVLSFDKEQLIFKKRDPSEKHEIINKLSTSKHTGLILFSSGSTGRPKAMVHNLDNLINSYQGRKNKRLVFLIFLMFDHIGGLNTLFNCLAMGVKIVIPTDRTIEAVCKLIEDHKVNILPASPTFLNLILIGEGHVRYDLSSLRLITYGTEPMPESLLLRLKESFGRVKFLQTFGTSETGITKTQSKNSTSTFIKIGDENSEYKIVDGELWLRSKTQILGYLNASMERFTTDGWFKTGDLVEVAEEGYLRIIGRNKEIINVGGEKVLPSEIESILLTHPDIIDCLVYGQANAITGQAVTADIVPKSTNEVRQLKRNIKKFCKERLDRYKVPAKINIVTKTNFSSRFKKKRIQDT